MSAVSSGAGGYVVGERLAVGGMAEVFLGQRKSDGRDVVIKRMLPQLARDAGFVKRFLAEGELAAQLSHPHIIEIVEMVRDGDDVMMVLEAVDGADLATIIKRSQARSERVPLAISLRIAHAIAEALTCAHEGKARDGSALNIIHRDVTPSNVLVGRDGAIKLIDFGIARASSFDHLTRVGTLVGKIHYLAPEQINQEPIDARVDVWAGGCVLFQLLTGRRPFDGATEPAVLMAIAMGERRDVRELAELPEELAVVVDRALAVQLDDRFPSARAMARALDDVIVRHGLRSPPSALGALVDELVPSQVDLTPFEGSSSGARSTRGLALDDGRSDPPPLEEPTVLFGSRRKANADDVTKTSRAPRPDRPPPSSSSTATAVTPAPLLATSPSLRRRRRRRSHTGPLLVAAAASSFALGAIVVFATRPDPVVVVVEAPPIVAALPVIEEPAPIEPPPPIVDLALPIVVPPPVAVVPPPVAPKPPVVDVERPELSGTPAPGPRRRAKTAPGQIVVDSRPWSTVVLDGKASGVTPTVLRGIRPGAHTLVLENKEQGLRKSVSVVVVAEESVTVRVDLKR
ncbi:MAG: serine/threonine-protein kinase [Deltaproteobacteria bacterium]|nr:serine/threonine-protein kinase [Deltaproteobacteria bacterium]